MLTEGDLRRDLLKEALVVRSQQGLLPGGLAYITILAALTATIPLAAVGWAIAGGVVGLGLSVAGARGLLMGNEQQVRAIAERVLRRDYAPQVVPPEMVPYVEQSIEAALRIIVQAERNRGTPSYKALAEVMDTVAYLLTRMKTMCEQVVTAEKLFDSISEQFDALPRQSASSVEATFNQNLRSLQKGIDAAREQIFQTASILQQMAVQAMLIQTQDLDLINATAGTIQQTASDQAELLQVRLQAMQEIAETTQAATSALVARR
jgi:hypothetical protein